MKKSFHLMPYCKKIAAGLLTAVLGLLMALLMLLCWNDNSLQIRSKPLLASSTAKIGAKENRLCIGFDATQGKLLLNLDLGERLQLSYSSTRLPS